MKERNMIALNDRTVVRAICAVGFALYFVSCSQFSNESTNPTTQSALATSVEESNPSNVIIGSNGGERCEESYIVEEKLRGQGYYGEIRVLGCNGTMITHIRQFWPSGMTMDEVKLRLPRLLQPSSKLIESSQT